ncbi:MAG: LysR family transcriptional regulator [Burkholderiaceae bacterium]|nr:LysR family transcriptional regulator [Burkholderiaceae bacterium]
MEDLLDVTLLRACVAVVDEGGFSEAAKALRVTQSAVSQQVARLEKGLGRAVFVRTENRRQPGLTSFGVELVAEARALLRAHMDARGRLMKKRGHLAVGVTPISADFASASTLRKLCALLGTEARIHVAPQSGMLCGLVSKGELDLAFVLNLNREDDASNVGHIEFHWFSAAALPCPPKPLSVVTYGNERCRIHAEGLDILAARGLSPRVVEHVQGREEACTLARAGVGIVLLNSLHAPGGLVAQRGLPSINPVAVKVISRKGLPVDSKRLQQTLAHEKTALRA